MRHRGGELAQDAQPFALPEPVARNSRAYDGRPTCCGNNNCMPICPIAAMYHGIVAATRANYLRWVVMLMDERARRLLTSMSCETFVLPGTWPGDYLGSPACTPLWADVQTMMDVQRVRNPEAHRLIGLGTGLDGISIPGPDGFVMRARQTVAASTHRLVPAMLESA